MRAMPNGNMVCNISVATNEKWKDKQSGEMKEETEWHSCTCFGRLAEVCGEYLKKGSSIYLRGKLKTQSWDDKETGQKRYRTIIQFNEMQMLGGNQQQGQQQNNQGGQPQRQNQNNQQRRTQGQQANHNQQQQGQQPQQSYQNQNNQNNDGFEDDIPFR